MSEDMRRAQHTFLRCVAVAAVLFATAACGREQWTTVAARRAAPPEPTSEPTTRPDPTPAPEPAAPRPEPIEAAAVEPGPSTPQPIPSSDLPGGPDGSDETKRDSGVRGQVVAGDRPLADAVVFVKGDGFQSNTTTGGAGRFHIHAPAGTYLVGARVNDASVHCADRTVAVPETSFTTVTISCTGVG
jgi:hypothetical protein